MTLPPLANYLTTQQIKAELQRLDYRHPNLQHPELFLHPYEGLSLAITFTTPNSYKPDETQTQRINIPIPPIASPQHFHHWLKWRLCTIAIHEVNEMYWLDGHPLNDPHTAEYWDLGRNA